MLTYHAGLSVGVSSIASRLRGDLTTLNPWSICRLYRQRPESLQIYHLLVGPACAKGEAKVCQLADSMWIRPAENLIIFALDF